MQSAVGQADALRLGGRRGDRSKDMQPNDVLKNFTYLNVKPSAPQIRNTVGTLGHMWDLEIKMT
jgi:hypothetical protein